jgi:hypothetical protein
MSGMKHVRSATEDLSGNGHHFNFMQACNNARHATLPFQDLFSCFAQACDWCLISCCLKPVLVLI